MIDLKIAGNRWTITINRPDKANALTTDMLAKLIEIAKDAHGQANVLVITGSGRVFSAGADLEEAPNGLAVSPLWEVLSKAVADLPCLTIAALNGTMAGGSFGMGLACDIRCAVPSAKFFYPVMKLGFLPQPSDPPRLVELIGPARAKMILMAGQKVSAQEALEWGLIDRIVSSDDMSDLVDELAKQAESATLEHISGIKHLVKNHG